MVWLLYERLLRTHFVKAGCGNSLNEERFLLIYITTSNRVVKSECGFVFVIIWEIFFSLT